MDANDQMLRDFNVDISIGATYVRVTLSVQLISNSSLNSKYTYIVIRNIYVNVNVSEQITKLNIIQCILLVRAAYIRRRTIYSNVEQIPIDFSK